MRFFDDGVQFGPNKWLICNRKIKESGIPVQAQMNAILQWTENCLICHRERKDKGSKRPVTQPKYLQNVQLVFDDQEEHLFI